MSNEEVDRAEFRDNPIAISRYLTEKFAENNLEEILGAIKLVLRAQNVQAIARETGLRRDRLYKTFGGDVDPQLSRVMALFEGFGVRFAVISLPARDLPARPKLGRPPKSDRPYRAFPELAARSDVISSRAHKSHHEEIADKLTEALTRCDIASFTAVLAPIVKERGVPLIAKQVGVCRQTLYRYAKGSTTLTFETAIKLASACGFDITLVPQQDAATPDAPLTASRTSRSVSQEELPRVTNVWVYEAGRENMKVFTSEKAAQAWLAEHDPNGEAFAYPVDRY
jgi:probable addiction module antidote protein